MPLDKSTRILIADDTALMRGVIKNNLRDIGVELVVEVGDGEAAWTAILNAFNSQTPFDAILCDWNMPKLSGMAVLKRLKAHPQLQKTPFLMITGETEKAQVLEAIKAGVSGYIMKPFSQAVFTDKFKKLFESST